LHEGICCHFLTRCEGRRGRGRGSDECGASRPEEEEAEEEEGLFKADAVNWEVDSEEGCFADAVGESSVGGREKQRRLLSSFGANVVESRAPGVEGGCSISMMLYCDEESRCIHASRKKINHKWNQS